MSKAKYVPEEDPLADLHTSMWTDDKNAMVLLNSKTHLFLTCALSREEYDRIEEFNRAKELCDTLKIHHEGSRHVKQAKIDIGVREFELFKMKEEETIDDMFSRLTIILNSLRSLGKEYSVQERI
ncbi:uncharacterized protein [Cicer arietinum]|uniref:Uncharacterized protein LOC105852433 n=1 Tax=Cicer arietinum TaxID=3827 RepID=A0A1S3EDZ1_CICAR|nr:uncharacterized protein LOC105852433 [Cicer arietinum]